MAEGGRADFHHAEILFQPTRLCRQQELLCLLPERHELQNGQILFPNLLAVQLGNLATTLSMSLPLLLHLARLCIKVKQIL